MAGYDPGGGDFPGGGAHATFSRNTHDDDACDRCGATPKEAVILGTPTGIYCVAHAGWYSKRILVQQWAIVVAMYGLLLLGLWTAIYFIWSGWTDIRPLLPKAIIWVGTAAFIVCGLIMADLVVCQVRVRAARKRRAPSPAGLPDTLDPRK